MRNNQKLNVLVWLNKQKKKDGRYPLYFKVMVDSKKVQIATQHFIKLTDWDPNSKRLKSIAANYRVVNAWLDRSCNLIQQEFLNHAARGEPITAQELKNNFLGIKSGPEERTLLEAITFHNDKFLEFTKSGQAAHSTWKKYNTTKNKVISFLKKRYKRKDMPLSEIRYSFATDLEHYLFTEEKLQVNTVYKSIKQLKKIMRICVDMEWIESNPIDRFKCTYKNPERVVLNQEEINAMVHTNFMNRRLEEIRDVFIFCCYTGFAYADVYKLKTKDLVIGIDGEYWLTIFRQKTGERESVPLLPIAYDIVQKYKEHPGCKKYGKLLPVMSNQIYNNYLKEVAALCGIDKTLTSHIARHTFATTVTLSNGVPIETVSKMLGHTRLVTTQIYAKVLDHKISYDMKALKEKLNPQLKMENTKVNRN